MMMDIFGRNRGDKMRADTLEKKFPYLGSLDTLKYTQRRKSVFLSAIAKGEKT